MNRIKQLRTEKSLSLRDLAKDFSAFLDQHGKKPITNVTISRWENEKNSPTAEMWGLLADYFGVSVDYLQGAWSRKEVLELMSSSLLDNYDRIYEMALEYGGDGNEWRFLDETSLGSTYALVTDIFGGVAKLERSIPETKLIDELRTKYFEGLAFAVLQFVYYRGFCHNYHTGAHFAYDSKIKADDTLNADEKNISLHVKSYPVIKGFENVHRFMMSFWRKRSTEERLTFLDDFFHEYEDNSILEDVVVNKIMQEKAPADTMALVLTSVIYSATSSFMDAINSEHDVFTFNRLEQQYKELSNEFDELQKENDRLKAELASKR